MLIARKSMLQSEMDALNTMVQFISTGQDSASKTVDALQKKVNYTTEKRDKATQEVVKARNECISQNAQKGVPAETKEKRAITDPTSDPCEHLKQATEGAVDATFQQAQASSELYSSSFLLNSNEKYESFMQSRIAAIQRDIEEIDEQLNNLDKGQVYLGEIADSKEFKALNRLGNETVQDYDSEWLQFEYDYDSTHINTSQDKSSFGVSAGFGGGIKGASLGASAYYGKGTADLQQAVNSASLKASGELLRVSIKRPWFRPSLFENSVLYFVSYCYKFFPPFNSFVDH